MCLYGIEFELYTDLKPLERMHSSRSKSCARIKRWILRLQRNGFIVKYSPGQQNIAPPLSCLLRVDERSEPSLLDKVADENLSGS